MDAYLPLAILLASLGQTALIGFLLWLWHRERETTLIHLKSRTADEFVATVQRLETPISTEKPQKPEVDPYQDLDEVPFDKVINATDNI